MMLIGVETNQPTNPTSVTSVTSPTRYRDLFNQGYQAGMINAIPASEIQEVVRILSTYPIEEWLTDERLMYHAGLLAGWLPVAYYPHHEEALRQYLQQEQGQGQGQEQG